jgi:hypothetical protein
MHTVHKEMDADKEVARSRQQQAKADFSATPREAMGTRRDFSVVAS